MKRSLLGFALVGALVAPAFAQVPQVGVTFGYVPKQTYSAGFIGLVPAASATDVICIAGSATKQIKIQSIKLSGSAGTAVSLPITVIRRASVNTGGTAASTTANPANTISKRDTTFATATATLIAYTANPTITDASPTYMDSAEITLVVTSSAIAPILLFDYGRNNADLLSPPVLRGIAQQICLNFNAISISSGLLNGVITWTEE